MHGSPGWPRSSDTSVNSRVLYQLSYGGPYAATVSQGLCG